MELKWRYATGGVIRGKPYPAYDGTIYVVSEDRYLYAFFPDGRVKWRCWLRNRVTDCLGTGYDGTIYVGLANGEVTAINHSGNIIWKKELRGAPIGTPAFYPDGTIIVSTEEGTIEALSHTGTTKWRKKISDGLHDGPVIGNNGNMYIPGDASLFFIVSRWGGITSIVRCRGKPASITNGIDNTIYVFTERGVLHAFSEDGTPVWEKELDSSDYSQKRVLVSKTRIILPRNDGRVDILDVHGNRVETKIVKNEYFGTMQCCVDSKGTVYCVTEMKTSDREYANVVKFGPPVLSEDGELYVGGYDWVLYAFTTDAVVAEQPKREIEEIPNTSEVINPFGENLNTLFGDSVDFHYLQSFASSLEGNHKSKFLHDVKRRINNGELGQSEPYVHALLMLVAGEGIIDPFYKGSEISKRMPDIQIEALRLLGQIGTYKTVGFLETLLQYEYDNAILCSIISALGNLRVDPKNSVIPLFQATLKKHRESWYKDRLALYVIEAIQKICRYRGYGDDMAVQALVYIYKSNYSKKVRQTALELVRELEAKQ